LLVIHLALNEKDTACTSAKGLSGTGLAVMVLAVEPHSTAAGNSSFQDFWQKAIAIVNNQSPRQGLLHDAREAIECHDGRVSCYAPREA